MDAQRSAAQEMQHPRGGLASRFRAEPPPTTASASAAPGDQRLAAFLDEGCGTDVTVLHDLSLGGARGGVHIDHLALTASGIYVIDEYQYQNAKVEIRRARGIFSSCLEHLYVQGCDATSFLDASDRKVAAVRQALAHVPAAAGVPVHAVLCFIEARFPARGPRELRGVSVLGPRLTAGLLGSEGPVPAAARQALHAALAQPLRAAA